MNNVKCLASILVLLCGIIGLNAQTPEWEWAVCAGGIGNDYGKAIAVDEFGNQYIIGYFGGTASFGSFTLNSAGSNDIFAVKLDPSGNLLWVVRAGGIGYDRGIGIAVDGAGNAYLTGWFYGTADFGAYTLNSSGDRDIFAAKLDPDGNFLWAIQAG
ncbi:MAG: SBBP repeat-containing protein, partial [Candidatus Cloacimonetes bacterium]|nr:SBBP repeat-containing protein [Candidatus Cloacimonadota bacterium]